MVKSWVPRLAVDTIHQCLLLHGHYGYTSDGPSSSECATSWDSRSATAPPPS